MQHFGQTYHQNFKHEKLAFPITIFEQNRSLLSNYKGINLSSGFPEWETPKFVKESLASAVYEPFENHYSDCAGQSDLRKTVAAEYSSIFNRELKPENVIIGNGGTGIISLLFNAFIKEGDEIVLIEPFFSYFCINVQVYGAVIKSCEMKPLNGKWTLDFTQLESCFSPKTRLVIVNSPHNPTGKVFSKFEVDKMVEIFQKFPDVIVLADEVYEKCIFDDGEFARIGTYKELWPRAVTVMSAGKTFNITGWRIGYAIADEPIINALVASQRASLFCINRPSSAAVAKMIPIGYQPYGECSSFYECHRLLLQRSRDMLLKGFPKIPQISVYPPQGGYFFVIGVENLIKFVPKQYFYEKGDVENGREAVGENYDALKDCDYTPAEACFYWLAKEIGVNMIPLDQFYDNEKKSLEEKKGRFLLRVSVTTKPESIESAMEKLSKISSIIDHKI